MIEIIYDERKTGDTTKAEKVKVPNNIRQIGESRQNLKIYLEDYVYTYLKRLSAAEADKGCMAVLLGETKWDDTAVYIFIRSALKVEQVEAAADHVELKDEQWMQIHEDIKKYFEDQEIIGWSMSLPGFEMQITDTIQKAHLDHFAGSGKVFLALEPTERDEVFFVYENGKLRRQPGFYIYYEKNQSMQSYMIEKMGNTSTEREGDLSDRAVLDFRKAVNGKERRRAEKRGRSVYVTGVCAAAALLFLGITVLNHRQMIKRVGELPNQSETASVSELDATDISPTEEVVSSGDESEKDMVQTSPEPEESKDDTLEYQGEEEGASSEETVRSEIPEEETTAQTYQEYTVQQGDTLTKISEMYYGGIWEVEEICRINQLESEDLIYAGQIILLP